MFDFIYKHIAEGIMRNIDLEALINSEETQKLILGFTDSLFERYKSRVLSSIGGSLKGTVQDANSENVFGNLPIPAPYKRLLKNPVVQMILGGLGQNQTQNQTQSLIPKELQL